jgi:hypothetical protein
VLAFGVPLNQYSECNRWGDRFGDVVKQWAERIASGGHVNYRVLLGLIPAAGLAARASQK